MADADPRYDEIEDWKCTVLECETDCSIKSHGISDPVFEQQTTETPAMAVTSPVVIGFRHVQALLLFLCLVVTNINRVNDPVGWDLMAKSDLDRGAVALVQNSLYWGMCLSPFIGGYVCHKLGAKITILISTFGLSVLFLITPYVIELRVGILVGITFIRGMFQGLLMPCVYDHIAKWAPIAERNRLGAFSFLGIEFGIILAMIFRDFIAESSLGWVSILTTPGALSLVWCLLWVVLADDSPAVSRFTSIRERAFIQASQENMNLNNNNQQKRYPIPWKAIFTSVPFYSLMIVQMTYAFGTNILQNLLPIYYVMFIREMFMSRSFVYYLPFLATFVMAIVSLVFADILLSNKVVSLTVLRKTIMSTSSLIPAAILIVSSFLDQNHNAVVVVLILMIISAGLSGGEVIGSGLNAIDLSSKHVAILTGVIAMAKHSMSVPLHFTFERVKSNMMLFFWIIALVFIFGNLQFIFFGSTTSQPWNEAIASQKKKNRVIYYKGPTRNRIESIAEETEAA